MAVNDKVNVCVIGCGHWGKNLVRSFAALNHLYAICDVNPSVSAAIAAQYPKIRAFAQPEDAFADPAVHAIILATPAEQHYSIGLAALAAGKDLYVEKPLALHWEEGAEMVFAAHHAGRILMVGHLLHYHPAVIRIKDLIHDGELGRIEYIYSNRLSMGKIRREENALWSFAPHDISVLVSLVGHLPLQVSATGGAYLQPNIADVTISNLLFDRGTRAHIFVSWLHPYKEQRLVVIGSKQMLVFEDSRPDRKLMLFNKHIELKQGQFEAAKPEGSVLDFSTQEPLLMECAHFVECVQERKTPRTPGEEGVQVLKVLEACQRSLQLNGQPVQLSAVGRTIMVM
jgi:UDP-2-acetamido-3-amino-2,3-dideoxy-glucuronate N-acetyltransferase